MPLVNCILCNKEFYTKPNWLKIGHGKYCSIKCARTSKRKGKFFCCTMCSKEVYKSLKEIKRSKSGNFFCSKKCDLGWLNGPRVNGKHHGWKHGEWAYRGILQRSGTPAVCVFCGKDDERILLVHHIDHNRKNNVLRNLSWLCQNCHYLVHKYQKENEVFLRKFQSLSYVKSMRKMQ